MCFDEKESFLVFGLEISSPEPPEIVRTKTHWFLRLKFNHFVFKKPNKIFPLHVLCFQFSLIIKRKRKINGKCIWTVYTYCA